MKSLFELYNVDEFTTSNDHFDRMQDLVFHELAKAKRVKMIAKERRTAKLLPKVQ